MKKNRSRRGILLKINICLVLAICLGNVSTGQNLKLIDKTYLKGYFLLYRKELDFSEKDHTEPVDDYKIFFVENFDLDVISEFILLDSLNSKIIEVAESWDDLNLKNGENVDSIYTFFNKKDPTNSQIRYNAFDFLNDVPKSILHGENRFISVYKGILRTIGPFKTSGNVLKRDALSYSYIKDSVNEIQYLYSVVLPLLSEEKKFLHPHAMKMNRFIDLANNSFFASSIF